MKKFLYAFLLFLLASVLVPSLTYAENAGEMIEGTWTTNPRYLTFGEYNGHALKWRVLEVYTSDGSSDNNNDNKTAFLMLDGVLREPASDGGGAVRIAFDDNNGDGKIDYATDVNNFPASTIKIWLDDTFLPSLADYQAGILTATYAPDTVDHADFVWYGGSKTDIASSKIFLLSVGEMANHKYFDIDFGNLDPNADRDVGEYYWLRSPGIRSVYTAVVRPDGSVHYFGYKVQLLASVRPALKINLSSSVFTSVFVSYPSKVGNDS